MRLLAVIASDAKQSRLLDRFGGFAPIGVHAQDTASR